MPRVIFFSNDQMSQCIVKNRLEYETKKHVFIDLLKTKLKVKDNRIDFDVLVEIGPSSIDSKKMYFENEDNGLLDQALMSKDGQVQVHLIPNKGQTVFGDRKRMIIQENKEFIVLTNPFMKTKTAMRQHTLESEVSVPSQPISAKNQTGIQVVNQPSYQGGSYQATQGGGYRPQQASYQPTQQPGRAPYNQAGNYQPGSQTANYPPTNNQAYQPVTNTPISPKPGIKILGIRPMQS